jgi:26S proteasome non-ATPase regulatory subunit 9
MLREELNLLMSQKASLELESDAIFSELTSPGPNGEACAGVKGTLIDSEGYPRGDIDIYNVKAKRRRLAEINTDHKALMAKIEKLIENIFNSSELDVTINATNNASNTRNENDSPEVLHPIFKIDEIFEGSPAEFAGIELNDLILKFGNIDFKTSDISTSIARLVTDSKDKRLLIKVKRASSTIDLSIVPKVWSGRGLLGCHLTYIPM